MSVSFGKSAGMHSTWKKRSPTRRFKDYEKAHFQDVVLDKISDESII